MIVFIIEEKEFGWDEINAAAKFWGEWDQLLADVRSGLACLKQATKNGELPLQTEVQSAANEFRYKNNLISGQETQLWLERWELTANGWMDYFRRSLLRQKWAAQSEKIAGEHEVSEEEIAAVIKNDAVCSGKFAEWARRLAGRAALAYSAAKPGLLDVGDQTPRNVVARIEAEFEQQRQQTITPKQVETKIADHRLDWIRFDCRYLWFGEERIAREAAFCVTEDGLTLDEVAAAAHGDVQQFSFYLDEIDPGVRPYFLAARQGDWLGPLHLMDGFPVFSIVAKQMPTAGDPQIQERAEQVILGGLISKAMNEQVKWMIAV